MNKINFFVFIIGFTALVLLAGVIFQRKIADSDLWLHLKAGEFILKERAVPKGDIFSFTKEGKPWIDHEWLFQVFCYSLFKNFSFEGLTFLKNSVFTFTLFILFLGVYTRFTGIPSLYLLFIFVGTALNRPTLRPDLFSLFFLTLFLTILYRKKNTPFLFILPILEVFWVNIHGYFFLGPLILLIFWIEEACTKRSLNLSLSSPLAGVFLLSILATFLNPYFLKGAFYPFFILKDMIGGMGKVLKDIIELQSPFRSKFISAGFYKASIIITSLSFFFALLESASQSPRKTPQSSHYSVISKLGFLRELAGRVRLNLLLGVTFFILSMKAIRNVHFFGAVSIYITLTNLRAPLKRVYEKVKPFKLLLLNSLLVSILCFFVWERVKMPLFGISYFLKDNVVKPSTYLEEREEVFSPYQEAEFLKNFGNTKRFFNDFNSGAFLIYKASPGFKVFIDGRTEVYGKDFLKDYSKLCKGDEEIFEEIVSKYNIEGFFVGYRGDLELKKGLLTLLYKRGWKVVFFGDSAIIFLKNSKKNEAYLRQYAVDLENWKAEEDDILQLKLKRVIPYSHIERLKVLEILKLDSPCISEAEAIIRIAPAIAFPYKVLGEVYLRRKSYLKAYENLYKAYILNLRTEEIFQLLAKVYTGLGRKKEAKEILNVGLKYYPKSKDIKKLLKTLRKKD